MHLKASVLCISEAFANRSNSVTPVGVPSHILIDALQANLQPRAAIRQHLHNISLSGFHCQDNSL